MTNRGLGYYEDRKNSKAFFQKLASDASKNAIEDAKEKGLSITYLEGNKLIKESADGTKEVVKVLENLSKRKVEPGTTEPLY